MAKLRAIHVTKAITLKKAKKKKEIEKRNENKNHSNKLASEKPRTIDNSAIRNYGQVSNLKRKK